jgi:hypothetical protein
MKIGITGSGNVGGTHPRRQQQPGTTPSRVRVSGGEAGRTALPVAGDAAAAKHLVMALVDQLGFDAVDGCGRPHLHQWWCPS